MMARVSDSVNFFVRYTSADRPWAEWIAWQLEDAGQRVIVQAWDMRPGSSFVVEMHEATRATPRSTPPRPPTRTRGRGPASESGIGTRRACAAHRPS